MKVKWIGLLSSDRDLCGGGPQGAIFWILEYKVQSNETILIT